MKATYTPGPWHIAETVKNARLDNARMIRPVDHHNYDYGATAIIATSEADAYLIAAAPDLAGSLQALLDWMRAHTGPADGAMDIMMDAAAVLDKARGY